MPLITMGVCNSAPFADNMGSEVLSMFPSYRWGAALAICALTLCAGRPAHPASVPPEKLAADLIAIRSQQGRDQWLNANKALLTQDLQKSLLARGDSLQKTGNYIEANRIYDISFAVAQHMSDPCAQVEALYRIGLSSHFQSDFDRALTFYTKAAGEAESNDCKLDLAKSLRFIGTIYDDQGKTDLSEQTLKRSFQIHESLQNKSGMARVLMDLGILMEERNDYDSAMQNYQKALNLAREAGDQMMEATALNNIAVNYDLRGNNDLAVRYYNQSLILNRKLKNDPQLANNLINLGSVYQSRGDFVPALHYIEEALSIQQRLKMKKGMAYSLTNIGQIYGEQGDYALALYYFGKVHSLFLAANLKAEAANILVDMGQIYVLQGKYETAIANFHRSGEVQRAEKNTRYLMRALCNLGNTYLRQHRLQQALQNYRECLKLGDRAPLANLRSSALLGTAQVYFAQAHYDDALRFATLSCDLARQGGYLDVLWQAETSQGQCYIALKQPQLARQSILQAIDVLEAQRKATVGGEEESQKFFETRTSPYELMVGLSLGDGQEFDALTYAERSRARVLLDVLHSGHARINAAMSDAEQKKEQTLSERIYLLNSQVQDAAESDNPDEKQISVLKSAVEKARLDLKAFESDLYSTHRELMVQRGDAPILNRDDAAKLTGDGQTAFLEYAFTKTKVYLFILTQHGLKVAPLSISSDRLKLEVETFHNHIAARTLGFQQEARSLYRSLIEPAADQIRDAGALVIVPDGILWDLPFQALISENGSYLIEKCAVSYAPSLTVLREMRNQRKQAAQPPAVLAFANPVLGKETIGQVKLVFRNQTLNPLPDAQAEANAIKRIYGNSNTHVYSGADALESALKQEISHYDIVHLATHGIVNPSNPLYSYLLFSRSGKQDPEDGLLEAWEIMKLPLKARLVVLSACDTARGRVGAGEGVVGLSWAFFVAGCPTSVVSQWKVESLSTSMLMEEFHRNVKLSLGGTGVHNSKAEALRKAALVLMKNEKYGHPFYWASFILIGDPS